MTTEYWQYPIVLVCMAHTAPWQDNSFFSFFLPVQLPKVAKKNNNVRAASHKAVDEKAEQLREKNQVNFLSTSKEVVKESKPGGFSSAWKKYDVWNGEP